MLHLRAYYRASKGVREIGGGPGQQSRQSTHVRKRAPRTVVLSEEVVHNGAPLRLNGVVQRPQRPQREHPMRLHGNAKTAPYTRELMVRRVLKQAEPVRDTAAAFGVSKTTLYKWLRRYREDGVAGLEDRSSRPHTSPRQTPAGVVHRILKLRRHRLTALGDLRAAVCTCLHGVTVAASARRGKTPGSGAQTTSTKVRTGQSGRDLAPGYQETRPYRSSWTPRPW